MEHSINGQGITSAFCSVGDNFYISDAQGAVSVYNVQSNTLGAPQQVHQKGINDICHVPSHNLLATASDDHRLIFSSVADDGRLQQCAVFEGHAAPVTTVAAAAHSVLTASGGYDENVRIFDVQAQQQVAVLPAHADPVTSVSFSSDGSQLASGSYDGLARVWDGRTGRVIKTFIGDTNPAVTGVLFFGDSILVSSLDSVIRQWNIRTGALLKAFDKHKNENLIIRPVIHNGSLFMGSEDGRVVKYNVDSGEHQDCTVFDNDPVLNLAILPSDLLAVNPFNSTVVKFIKI